MPSAGLIPPGFVTRNWKNVLNDAPTPRLIWLFVKALPPWEMAAGVRRSTEPSPVTAVAALPLMVSPVVLAKLAKENGSAERRRCSEADCRQRQRHNHGDSRP